MLSLTTLPTIAEALPVFVAWLRSKKLSETTITTYGKRVRAFADDLAARIGEPPSLGDITAQAIEAYQEERAHLGPKTLTGTLTALRSFLTWCQRKGYRLDDPTAFVDWPKRPDAMPKALTSDELARLERILAARPRRAMPATRRRLVPLYRRAVLLMLYAGLRRSEAADLTWEAIDLRAGTLRVVGKGGRHRIVPLHPRLSSALLAVPPEERRGPVLPSTRTGERRAHKAMGLIFEGWLRDEGLDISAHQLRHTFASQLLAAGADLESIRQLLGHQSLDVTKIYLRLDPRQRAAAVLLLPSSFAQEGPA